MTSAVATKQGRGSADATVIASAIGASSPTPSVQGVVAVRSALEVNDGGALDLAAVRAILAAAILDGATPTEATKEVLSGATLDIDAREECIRLGVMTIAHHLAHDLREGEPEAAIELPRTDRGRFQIRPRAKSDVLTRVQLVVDGVNKRLLDMTLADCKALQDRAAAQETAWASQERAFGVAIGLLNLKKVDRVASLDASALQTLRDAMEQVTSW